MLNIKDEETDRLAREVAAMTGETLTMAVRTALQERKERLSAPKKREIDWAALRRIQAEAALGDPSITSESHNDLYGDDGMPA